MNRFNKFNLVFESFIDNLALEATFKTKAERFDFKENDEGDVSCMFDTFKDGNRFNVVAVNHDGKFIFNVTNMQGDVKSYDEMEFSNEFSFDYNELVDAFRQLNQEEDEEDDEDEEDESSEEEIANPIDIDDRPDEDVKMSKTIKIKNTTFIFNMLHDHAVDNYCECLFQKLPKDSGPVIYYKSLIDIKEKNSLIIKILKFDEDGNALDAITETDFKNEDEELYERLITAIKQMEVLIWEGA